MTAPQVPAATIHAERRGEGPPLLLVPGAGGDARVFASLADRLATSRTVITYDRRGYSRSAAADGHGDEDRLRLDAADAARLVRATGRGPAAVLGSSSGAVVALRLLLDHPDVVSVCVVHEPACFALLPDAEQWRGWFDRVLEIYRAEGPSAAVAAHRERAFPPADRAAMEAASTPGRAARANAVRWLERELRQYTAADVDLDGLRPLRRRIVPAAGRESTGYPTARIALELASSLGLPVTPMAGGHIGYATDPDDFACDLRTVLPPVREDP